jgi:hypothetical protein
MSLPHFPSKFSTAIKVKSLQTFRFFVETIKEKKKKYVNSIQSFMKMLE